MLVVNICSLVVICLFPYILERGEFCWLMIGFGFGFRLAVWCLVLYLGFVCCDIVSIWR